MSERFSFAAQIRWLAFVAGMLLLLHIINSFTQGSLSILGLIPRQPEGLWRIFTAPWVHGSWFHLLSNLPVLLLFMALSMQWGKRTFTLVSFTVLLISGLAVWLFGRSAVHLGASGMLYGYFGLLLLAGFRARRFRTMLLSLFIALAYGGLLFGVLPLKAHISFEYHLFGFLAGSTGAFLWVKPLQSLKAHR